MNELLVLLFFRSVIGSRGNSAGLTRVKHKPAKDIYIFHLLHHALGVCVYKQYLFSDLFLKYAHLRLLHLYLYFICSKWLFRVVAFSGFNPLLNFLFTIQNRVFAFGYCLSSVHYFFRLAFTWTFSYFIGIVITVFSFFITLFISYESFLIRRWLALSRLIVSLISFLLGLISFRPSMMSIIWSTLLSIASWYLFLISVASL